MASIEPMSTSREPLAIPVEIEADDGPPTALVSFDAFFAEQFPPLVRVALLIVGSAATAEEIVQDAFIRVYRRWDGLENPAAFARVCVVNGCRDRLRRRARWRVRVPLVATDDSTSDDHGTNEDDDLLALVRALPERQRTAIVLRYYEDLTQAEIADALGLSSPAVKSLLHRALENIRKEMAP
jgi:RNA polymerase sigma-70 factor (sigma-E family)